MKPIYLKVDSRNRVSLTKLAKDVPALFKAYAKEGKIILEPVHEIPAEEAWLFEAKNKELLDQLKKSLTQEASIDLGSFKKYSKE